MTLKEKIARYKKQMAINITDEANAVMSAAKTIVQSSISARAIPAVGQPFPEFSLPDSKGNVVSLGQLTSNGPAVVTMFRGAW